MLLSTRSVAVPLLLLVVLALLLCAPAAVDAFGVSTSAASYTINTDSGLTFAVRRQGLSNQKHVADLCSLQWRGTEFQLQTIGSQINTGLSPNTALSVDSSHAGFIVVRAADPDNALTHYYIAKQGQAVIYMATYPTKALEMIRFITRIPYNLLPNGPAPSDLHGNTGAIESGDVFGMSNGQTRSKHYSNHRQMDWTYTGATGSNVGIWMIKGNTEGMSSGPFYRSLINQGGDQQEIYNIISYGAGQLDGFRLNVLNLYALVFTTGGTPNTPDFSVLSGLGLQGFVGSSGRGRVLGVGLTPFDSAYQYVVGFANAQAQYWTTASGNSGSFGCYDMLPGNYSMTVYKGELEVWTGSAVVSAGSPTSLHTLSLSDPAVMRTPIWRIGRWDGTPNEFMNGALLTYMHPSDSRMSSWTANTKFDAASVQAASFPAVQFRGVNAPLTLTFSLNAAQAANAHTLRVGITIDSNNGRPTVNLNGNGLRVPGASDQPDTRSITVGTYRGRNFVFEYALPTKFLKEGANTIELWVASGNKDPGQWLSAAYTFDCLEMI